MSGRRCERVWEAEAIEDGRLSGGGRDAFLRHARVCGTCSRTLSELDGLRALSRSSQVAERTELQRRRLRVELLRRADQSQKATPGPRARWIAVAVLVLCALVIGARVRATRKPTAVAASPASYEVTDLRGASWHLESPAPSAVIALDEGEAAFHVTKLHEGERFRVRLPDGEIEVRGTRFVVAVRGHKTQHVSVSEGVVALHIVGTSEHVLLAGESWEVPREIASVPSTTFVPAAGAMTAFPPHASTTHTPAVPSSANHESGAGPKFGAAMNEFSASRYADAELLFTRFCKEFPADARCEDASFLRAVCRQKLGDAKGAAQLARAYLDRWPSGLRRTEAERLAKSSE